MDTRRKILFYINPANSQADKFASLALDSVAQGERGRLQRASMLAGLALYKIDPRLPFLLSELLTDTTSQKEILQVISVLLPEDKRQHDEMARDQQKTSHDTGETVVNPAGEDETRRNAQAMFKSI